jgi:hypothetical protein
MKTAELNIGLSSNIIGEISPRTVERALNYHGFTVIESRLAESEAEGETELCFACKVELPENWQEELFEVSLTLGQNCIAVAGFIGRKPYDAFIARHWISPDKEEPEENTLPLPLQHVTEWSKDSGETWHESKSPSGTRHFYSSALQAENAIQRNRDCPPNILYRVAVAK